MNGAAEHNNGIGSAKVAPGVAAWAADRHFKAAAAERFRNDRVSACPIEHNARLDRILPLWIRKNVSHPAKIAFALLAYIADEDKRIAMRKIEVFKCRGDSEQRRYAGSIVGNARAIELAALLPDIEGSVRGKDGIQMSADGNDFWRVARIAAEDVANAVLVNFQQSEGVK